MRVASPVISCIILTSVSQSFVHAAATEDLRKYQDFAAAALGAPPEIAADLLVQLAESPKAASDAPKAQRVQWLEQAFSLAPQAAFSIPRGVAGGEADRSDSDSGATDFALRRGLDTLSLQVRVARSMLSLDVPRAIEMFQSIHSVSISASNCSDSLVYSPGPHYELVADIYTHGFTEAEKKEQKDSDFLVSIIAASASPMELAPAARLALLEQNPSALQRLVAAYATRLNEMRTEYRAFAAALNSHLLEAFQTLIAGTRAAGLPRFSVLRAMRSYLVRNLGGEVCLEAVSSQGERVRTQYIQTFNAILQVEAGVDGADIHPISPQEIKPSRIGDRMQVSVYWRSPRSQALLAGLKRLRFGTTIQQSANTQQPPGADGRAPFLTTEQRSDPAWEAAVQEFLNDVSDWNRNQHEPELDSFHMMSIINQSVIELIPSGRPLRRDVLSAYIVFLQQSHLRRDNPPEWLSEAMYLIHAGRFPEDDIVWLRDELSRVADPVLSLYVQLDQFNSSGKR